MKGIGKRLIVSLHAVKLHDAFLLYPEPEGHPAFCIVRPFVGESMRSSNNFETLTFEDGAKGRVLRSPPHSYQEGQGLRRLVHFE